MTEASALACLKLATALLSITGSRDGTVVKALTSHHWGPGLTPGPIIIKGLSLLLVLAPRVFHQGLLVSLPPIKPTLLNSNST